MLDIFLYVLFVGLSVKGAVYVMKAFSVEWFFHLAQAFLIYFFLPCIFAVCAGLLISFVQSINKGRMIALLLFVLFSNIFTGYLFQCVSSSEWGTQIVDIFGVVNRHFDYYCDLFYNYSVESVNVERILFWIFLSLAVFCFIACNQKKMIMTTLFSVAAAVLFILYIQPSGYRYFGGDWGNELACQQYYSLLYNACDDSIARRYKVPDFKVKEYKGKVEAKRVLKASVDVIIDKVDLKEYDFTLYHGYQIHDITDENGEKLLFQQKGDHILVQNNKLRKIRAIHFEYSGFSKKYVATGQAVFLGGNFPYLPWPGWGKNVRRKYVSEPEIHEDYKFWNIETDLTGIGYKTKYDIYFYSHVPVCSNLEEKGRSHFVGKTEGGTFVASSFLRKMEIGHAVLYYTIMSPQYYKNNLVETKNEYEKVLKKYNITNKIKIFDVGNMGDGDEIYYFSEDHIIGKFYEIDKCYPFYIKNGLTPAPNDL